MARLAEPIDGQRGHFSVHQQLWQTFGNIAFLPPPSTAAANSANLKAAIADAISGGFGSTVFIPPETYLLNDYHTIANVSGLRIVGAGHRSRLVSTLNDVNHAVLEFDDVRQSYTANLYMGFNATIGGAIRFRNVTGGSVTPSMNTTENVHIECAGKVQFPLILGGIGNTDANNDFNVFRDVYAIGYTKSGCYLRVISQSYGNQFEDCYFFGGAGAEHAVNAGGGFAGNFAWRGGFVGGHTVSDFNIGRSYQPFVIDGVNSENSARFLTLDGQAYMNLSVRNSRWAGNAAHADGKIIKLSGNVLANFEDNSFGDGSGDRALTIELATLSAVSHVRFARNRVYSSAASVFDTTAPHELVGNQKITNEGNGTTMVLTL